MSRISKTSREAFPVNSIFISVVSTNPSILLGYGTWVAYAQGLYLVGVPASGTAEGTAGTALTDKENRAAGALSFTGNSLGTHSHNVLVNDGSADWNLFGAGASSSSGYFGRPNTEFANASNTGNNANVAHTTGTSAGTPAGTITGASSVAGTNAPYIQVYMWKRTN
jgi:hypothetical protein